jgi:hypothetical protein
VNQIVACLVEIPIGEVGLFALLIAWFMATLFDPEGPIWMPVNYLLIESLEKFDTFYTSSLSVEFPKGIFLIRILYLSTI